MRRACAACDERKLLARLAHSFVSHQTRSFPSHVQTSRAANPSTTSRDASTRVPTAVDDITPTPLPAPVRGVGVVEASRKYRKKKKGHKKDQHVMPAPAPAPGPGLGPACVQMSIKSNPVFF
jgi:hypothetical protein